MLFFDFPPLWVSFLLVHFLVFWIVWAGGLVSFSSLSNAYYIFCEGNKNRKQKREKKERGTTGKKNLKISAFWLIKLVKQSIGTWVLCEDYLGRCSDYANWKCTTNLQGSNYLRMQKL